MPKIKIITREFESATCELPDGGITVGRDAQNAMVIADASVSRQHCELLVFGREVIVRDRASRNGTFVDRKSTRLNSSHGYISYAVFCLKKKKKKNKQMI